MSSITLGFSRKSIFWELLVGSMETSEFSYIIAVSTQHAYFYFPSVYRPYPPPKNRVRTILF